ncbi:MAG: DUF3307 domain-containing protein [Paracoccaceae bacterium]
MDLISILILLGLLQFKHMFADFFLQTPIMLMNRATYVHPGRALHCAVHVVGSALCFLVMGVPLALGVIVLACEGIAHFHIDYLKGVWSERAGHGPADAGYWRAFGADQTLHQLTYVGMVWAVL